MFEYIKVEVTKLKIHITHISKVTYKFSKVTKSDGNAITKKAIWIMEKLTDSACKKAVVYLFNKHLLKSQEESVNKD